MKTFKQMLLKELKMSRFIDHLKNDPFVIIMSVERSVQDNCTSDMTEQQYNQECKEQNHRNRMYTTEFRGVLKQERFSFIPVEGSYSETNKIDSSQKLIVNERSNIIFTTESRKQQLYDLAVKWAAKRKQECISYIEKNKLYYLYTNDVKDENGNIVHRKGSKVLCGYFHAEQIDDIFTELNHGSRFTFHDKIDTVENIKRYLNIE